ncbi:MAG: VOC family protein, partial [Vampirovibrionia bacterium]
HNVRVRIVFLKTKHDNLTLELFQYINPVGKNAGVNPANTIPLGHIAFKVQNIFDVYEELKSQGVNFTSEPQNIPDGVTFCYMRDPDGVLIELIEFPE